VNVVVADGNAEGEIGIIEVVSIPSTKQQFNEKMSPQLN
jgi:hypothetical protein